MPLKHLQQDFPQLERLDILQNIPCICLWLVAILFLLSVQLFLFEMLSQIQLKGRWKLSNGLSLHPCTIFCSPARDVSCSLHYQICL